MEFCEAKGVEKKAVAVMETVYCHDIGKTLDASDFERIIYRLAKSLQRQTESLEGYHDVNDHGQLLMNRRKVMERWRDYFDNHRRNGGCTNEAG